MSKVLVMRTCNADMTSYGGFVWPESGAVSAPDWSPEPQCGHGLHGLLWGEGDVSLLDWSKSAKWLVCSVDVESIVEIGDKVKFPSCEVVFCGDGFEASKYVVANGGQGRRVVKGTATAGFRGTATAGFRGTATAGDEGTATAGDEGTAKAGFRGTAKAGFRGNIAIMWNGRCYKVSIATIKDEYGDGQLEPNVKYKLDDSGNFSEAE